MAQGKLDSAMDMTLGAFKALQAKNPKVVAWYDKAPFAVLDPCPLDPFDEVDHDGLCADTDACPNDPSNDAGHERFLNLVRGEHTVSDGSGHVFQVDNSHQKYFVNPTTNTR